MKPKVVLLATGGTIASRYDPALKRTVASARAEDLLEALPQVGEVARHRDRELRDDAELRHDRRSSLSASLGASTKCSRAPRSHGVVVTHGTDTMEETSYLADLLLQSDKPAVFTGAQRAADDPHSDGPPNLLNAIRVAAVDARRVAWARWSASTARSTPRATSPKCMRARWRPSSPTSTVRWEKWTATRW